MTKYLGDSFSVFPGSEKNYRDNYDKIFRKDKESKVPAPAPDKMEPVDVPEAPPELLKEKPTKKPKKEKKPKTK